ncbi:MULTISPECIES: S1 family peptidase [unclassified Actinomyces]|uniref:S1 family peptidase n=1 Tax=unclassified Actinomyces TaxID=2609248 RepID=UPI0011BD73A8|nr:MULTISPECIES: S1 family peptidase [unclassified Actinomyces]
MSRPIRQFTSRRASLALLTLSLSIGIGAPALGQPSDNSDRGSVSEAAAEDAAFDAQTSEQSENEILEDIAFQDLVNETVDPVILKHEDIFAEAGFNGDGTAYVVFTEPIPEEDASRIRAVEGVTLSEDGVYTAHEADELMEEISDAVEDGLPEDAAFLVQVSPVSGETTIAASDTVQSEATSEVQRIVEESQPRDTVASPGAPGDTLDPTTNSSPQISFEVDTTLEAEDQAVNGGDKLTITNTTTHHCTAAFPAKSGGHSGLLTAGHCQNDLTVDQGNRLYSATKEKRHLNGDMQWHRAREAVNGRFRYQWGTYRAVKAHPVLKVGTKVCRFGATTGNGTGCTTVVYVSACITYSDEGEYCKLAMTDSHTGSKDGDSGGPWFYGNSAYGIHSGSGTRDGVYRNWFYPSRKAVTADGISPIYDDDGAIR